MKYVRIASGLGDPPEPFYTNDVENMNWMIKLKTNYKTSEWPDFCCLARQLAEEQENEVEKAVIRVGEYRFGELLNHLQIPLSKWSSMSRGQRRKYLNNIHQVSLHESDKLRIQVSKKDVNADASLCFTIDNKLFDASSCQLSNDIIRNMFAKTERLVAVGSNSICPSPGSVNAKLVESSSGQRPYYVVKKSSNKYNCDSDCPMWKCSKLCSHTIACAYRDGCLQEFLNQSTQKPSFYALAKTGTASNAGKKPAKRKGVKKSTTKVVAELCHLNSAKRCVGSLPASSHDHGENRSVTVSTSNTGTSTVVSSNITDSSLVQSPVAIHQSVPAGIQISSSSLTHSPIVDQSVGTIIKCVRCSNTTSILYLIYPVSHCKSTATD